MRAEEQQDEYFHANLTCDFIVPHKKICCYSFGEGSCSLIYRILFVQDVDSESLLHYEYFSLKQRFSELDHVLEFFVSIGDPMPPQYFVRVVSDR